MFDERNAVFVNFYVEVNKGYSNTGAWVWNLANFHVEHYVTFTNDNYLLFKTIFSSILFLAPLSTGFRA